MGWGDPTATAALRRFRHTPAQETSGTRREHGRKGERGGGGEGGDRSALDTRFYHVVTFEKKKKKIKEKMHIG